MTQFKPIDNWDDIQQIITESAALQEEIVANSDTLADEICKKLEEHGIDDPNPAEMRDWVHNNAGRLIAISSIIGLLGGDLVLMEQFGIPFLRETDGNAFFNSVGSVLFSSQKLFGMLAPNHSIIPVESNTTDTPFLSKIHQHFGRIKTYAANHKSDTVSNSLLIANLCMSLGYITQANAGSEGLWPVAICTALANIPNALMVGVNYHNRYGYDDENQPALITGKAMAKLLDKLPDSVTDNTLKASVSTAMVTMAFLLKEGFETGDPNFIIAPLSISLSVGLLFYTLDSPEPDFKTIKPEMISTCVESMCEACSKILKDDIANSATPDRARFFLDQFRLGLVKSMKSLPVIHASQHGFIEQECERALAEYFPEYYTARTATEVENQLLPLSSDEDENKAVLLPANDIRAAQANRLNPTSAQLCSNGNVQLTYEQHNMPYPVAKAADILEKRMQSAPDKTMHFTQEQHEKSATYTACPTMLSAWAALSADLTPHMQRNHLYIGGNALEKLVNLALMDCPQENVRTPAYLQCMQ